MLARLIRQGFCAATTTTTASSSALSAATGASQASLASIPSTQGKKKTSPQPRHHTEVRTDLPLSYVNGVSNVSLQYKTIGVKFRETADKFADNIALISHEQQRQFTWSQYYEESERLAAGLLKLGLKKGDRLGIYSPNNYEWCLTQFAAAMADLILVNINPAYQEHELEYCLNKVGVKALIMASHHKKSDYINILRGFVPELETSSFGGLKAIRAPLLQFVIRIDDIKTPGMGNFKDILEIDDATNIQLTSGTTGTPKAATLTHFNIINNAFFLSNSIGFTHEDRICLSVPLYHCFGMVMGNLCSINSGAAIVLPSEGFNAKRAMESITQYKCTTIYGVPTMFLEYVREYEANPTAYNYTSLNKGIMAGSLCPESLMKKLISEWGVKNIQIAYGQTEAAPVVSLTKEADSFEDRCQSVGKVYPHTEIKIIDMKGHVVPRGEKGEICVRGFGVMQKYWGDRKATAKTIDKDGWLKSGDMGQFDENGFLKIVGRFKEMIIRGGENIYPKEIEEYLRAHPSIADVQVVGIADEKYGEEIFAIIRLKENVEKLKNNDIFTFCKGRIAHFKIPKYVKFVESFPLTVTGKVQKFIIVKELEKERHLFEQYLVRNI